MADISPSAVPGSEHFYRFLMDEKRSNAANAAALAGKASTTQTVIVASGLIEAPEDKDYKIIVKSPVAFTVTALTTICTAGTATLTGKINSTALGGTANSVSTSEQERAHSTSNAAAVGDDLVLTVSSASGCEMMTFTVAGTVTLA